MTEHQNTYIDLVNVEDWLNAKGYTGEAGACHAAMSLIRKQEARIAALEAEVLAGNDWLNARAAVLQELAEANARIAELEAARSVLWRLPIQRLVIQEAGMTDVDAAHEKQKQLADLVARLRGPRTEQGGLWPIPNLHEEAADAIERLALWEDMGPRQADAIVLLTERVAAMESALSCSIVSGNDARERCLEHAYALSAATARIKQLEGR